MYKHGHRYGKDQAIIYVQHSCGRFGRNDDRLKIKAEIFSLPVQGRNGPLRGVHLTEVLVELKIKPRVLALDNRIRAKNVRAWSSVALLLAKHSIKSLRLGMKKIANGHNLF